MEIFMDIRKIRENELLEVCKLSSICFEYPFNEEGLKEEQLLQQMLSTPESKGIRYWQQIWGAFNEQEELLSCLNVIPFQFHFDGNTVPATGIGNVCTYPHHRKKGAVKAVFQEILPAMYKDSVLFSYLYPFSEGFYRKFGYEHAHNSTTWDMDLSQIPVTKYQGSFSLYGKGEPLDDFKSVYIDFAKKHNMMVCRDSHDWSNITDAKGAYNNQYAYLYKDVQGIPRGYLVFKKEVREQHSILVSRELIFDSFETLKAIFSFASTYSGDYRLLHFQAPDVYNLEYFCRDYPQSLSRYSMALNGMVRVINAADVLKKAAYKGSGSLSIKIIDPQIEENNGIFQVSFHDNFCKEIIHSKEGAFDISMPISLFSAAVVGTLQTQDLAYQDEVVILCNTEKLEPVFYKKAAWINNYF